MSKKENLEARRQHIVESALKCFLEKGYNQSGVRDIATRAGISIGNLYNHFKSKEAVLAAIAAEEEKELLPFIGLLNVESPPEQVLARFLEDYLTYCSHPDALLITLEIIGEAVRNPEIADLFMANRKKLVAALSGLLQKGQAAGIFAKLDAPDENAEIILDTIEGYAFRKLLAKTDKRTHLKTLNSVIFNAIKV